MPPAEIDGVLNTERFCRQRGSVFVVESVVLGSALMA